MKKTTFLLGCLLTLLMVSTSLADAVKINEIMHHPASQNPNEQWVELYNNGTNAVNLQGWHFSKGVNYTFPAVTLPPDGYLVVAADLNAFTNPYPAVANVVGSWVGRLSFGGEEIELSDAQDQRVDDVIYSDGGDWGVRLQGSGAKQALGITRSATTATVTLLGNYNNGDRMIISGADQPEYNGTNTISGVIKDGGSPFPCTTFNYTVSGAPQTPVTGVIVCRQITDVGRTGWAWSSPSDGLGKSLELRNPNLSNQYGQNWQGSLVSGGTPGSANSVLATNTAPLILETKHHPLVPSSTNSVTITARILDEHTNDLTVILHWRVDAANPGAFTATPMLDDGQHNDGLAGDGFYGGYRPAPCQ